MSDLLLYYYQKMLFWTFYRKNLLMHSNHLIDALLHCAFFFIFCQLIYFQKLFWFVFLLVILHCIFDSMILHIFLFILTCLNSNFLLAHTSSKLVIKNHYHFVVFLSLWMMSYLILWLIWSALLNSVSNSCKFWQQTHTATVFFQKK